MVVLGPISADALEPPAGLRAVFVDRAAVVFAEEDTALVPVWEDFFENARRAALDGIVD